MRTVALRVYTALWTGTEVSGDWSTGVKGHMALGIGRFVRADITRGSTGGRRRQRAGQVEKVKKEYKQEN